VLAATIIKVVVMLQGAATQMTDIFLLAAVRNRNPNYSVVLTHKIQVYEVN
jgi:hypothetical protein